MLDTAKIAIFAASLLSGVAGWLVLRTSGTPEAMQEADPALDEVAVG